MGFRATVSSGSSAASTTFPATYNNRNKDELLRDIAGVVGGARTKLRKEDADRHLRAAIRSFNDTPWTFNRLSQEIDLTSPVAGTNGQKFLLTGPIRVTLRANLLDSDGISRRHVDYVAYERWITWRASNLTTATVPRRYSIENLFETGHLYIDPPLGDLTPKWPTLKITYHRPIDFVGTGTNPTLQVPPTVEEAIVQLARAHMVSEARTFVEARDARTWADDLREKCEFRWRDEEDF